MSRKDLNYMVGIALLIAVVVTGILGYIQSELELRRFFPHRYAAYTTLCLAGVHVYLNSGKLWRYLQGLGKGKNSS